MRKAGERGQRDRPLGPAPVGTSFGLAAVAALGPMTPIAFLLAVAPWSPDMAATTVGGAMASMFVWIAIFIPLVIGFKAQRYWGVIVFFATGVWCLAALPAALTTTAILLLATRRHAPGLVSLTWFGFALLALMMITLWPWLLRALRLRYWQPWTRSEAWETGAERAAGWVYKAAGVETPPGSPPRPAAAKRHKGAG